MRLFILAILYSYLGADFLFQVKDKNGNIINEKMVISKKKKNEQIVENKKENIIENKEKKEQIDPYEEDMKIIFKALDEAKEQHKKIFGTRDEDYKRAEKFLKKFQK